jgi:hypothetical protein
LGHKEKFEFSRYSVGPFSLGKYYFSEESVVFFPKLKFNATSFLVPCHSPPIISSGTNTFPEKRTVRSNDLMLYYHMVGQLVPPGIKHHRARQQDMC